ncbi:DUF262 domain-containing protein [Reichenbachiella sp. MSK19-1]|uniref:DUF262 domain-containing protein n=1 Tax=Reichenbachiella sp. MSK19-1 TaxID=1897631 RepID=UPI000E6C654A|nr:DUF262 domain-containing protein [Reichenbachiella sp. MSK19-1]RJE75227.1 hypothetical protein BGP76_19195 [Reichenbachiella sp. MSK19-1]
MKIEFKTGENEFVLLTVFRKTSGEDHFELMTEENESWMELILENNSFVIQRQDERIKETEEDTRTKLNQLVLEVIEAEQSGTDINATDSLQTIQPFDPEDIKVHAKQFSLRLISDMIDDKDIDLSPDFQRNLVWNNFQKSRLIESILLRIPLPMFYFSEDDEGRITIVDGLQRISTIKDFMDNKFRLRNLEYLQDSCDGRYFKDEGSKKGLDAKYLRWFNQTQFSVNVIDPSSPSKVKYDIFRRINTGGKPLNNQEIRNCLAGTGLRDTLRKMTELEEFRSATDYSIRSTRMEDQEVALRFILFSKYLEQDNISDYNGSMDNALDSLTETLYKTPQSELEHYVDLFRTSMLNAKYLLGEKHAFRKIRRVDIEPDAYKQLINKALFVSLSVILSPYNHALIRSKNEELKLLEPLASEIEDDKTFLNYLSYGTNGRSNIIYAFEKVQQLVSNNLTLQ